MTGAVYVVQSWTDANITVTLHRAYVPEGTPPTYTVSHAKAGEIFRLQFALVYASIQGRTCQDMHIALIDLHNPHITVRDIITAMSRPTHGKYLHFVHDDSVVLAGCTGGEEDFEGIGKKHRAAHRPHPEGRAPA